MPDPACLVHTSLQPAEHLASNSSAITEERKASKGHLQTLRWVKWFRERGWKSWRHSRSNATSVCHGRAGAPEKRRKLIQLLLRAARHSKDTSALREEGARGKAAGACGMQVGQIMEEPEGQALLQASSETS